MSVAALPRWLRAVSLLLLLVAPTGAAEIWLRGSLRLLYPGLKEWAGRPDAKLMMLHESGCPDVIALGTSLTEAFFGDDTFEDPGPGPGHRRIFNLAVAGGRASDAFVLWRKVRASGCTPSRVYLEADPGIANQGGLEYGASTFDLSALLALPRGVWSGDSVARLCDITTWEQLLVVRRRVEIRAALRQAAQRIRTGLVGPFPPGDGRIRAPRGRRLDEESAEEQRQARLGRARGRGPAGYLVDGAQVQVYRSLVAAIREAGTEIVLFSPPLSPTFRGVFEQMGGKSGWCGFAASLRALPDVPWHSDLDAPEFRLEHFEDDTHLNVDGAGLFGARLAEAVRSRRYRRDSYCP